MEQSECKQTYGLGALTSDEVLLLSNSWEMIDPALLYTVSDFVKVLLRAVMLTPSDEQNKDAYFCLYHALITKVMKNPACEASLREVYRLMMQMEEPLGLFFLPYKGESEEEQAAAVWYRMYLDSAGEDWPAIMARATALLGSFFSIYMDKDIFPPK